MKTPEERIKELEIRYKEEKDKRQKSERFLLYYTLLKNMSQEEIEEIENMIATTQCFNVDLFVVCKWAYNVKKLAVARKYDVHTLVQDYNVHWKSGEPYYDFADYYKDPNAEQQKEYDKNRKIKIQEARINELEAELKEKEGRWDDEVSLLKYNVIYLQGMVYDGMSEDHKNVIRNIQATIRFYDSPLDAVLHYCLHYNKELLEVLKKYDVGHLLGDDFISSFNMGDELWGGGEPYQDYVNYVKKAELWVKYNE